MIREMKNEELNQVAGGLAPIVWFVAGVIARRYAAKAVQTAVTGAVAGAVGAALRE